jgi:hypothetical protein
MEIEDHTTEQVHNNIAAMETELAKLKSDGPDFSGLPAAANYKPGMSDAQIVSVDLARRAAGEAETSIRVAHADRIRHLTANLYALRIEAAKRGGSAPVTARPVPVEIPVAEPVQEPPDVRAQHIAELKRQLEAAEGT